MESRFNQLKGAHHVQSTKQGYLRGFSRRPNCAPAERRIERWSSAILTAAVMSLVRLLAATPEQSHLPKEDLTAKECLAIARQQRQAHNWIAAAVYYKQLDAEYSGDLTQARETLRYRLEHLDCILISKNHADAVKLIDLICISQRLPSELYCELLFERGKCCYHLQNFKSARASLHESLTTGQRKIKNPAWDLKAAEAHILIAQCLIGENRTEDAILHLSSELQLDPQTHAIASALQTRLYLDLRRPEQAWCLLKTHTAELRSWNLPASCDALLVETANQFCAATAPEKAIQCLLLTLDSSACSGALKAHIKAVELQTTKLSTTAQPGQRLAECRRVLSLLSNELNVLNEVQEQKPKALNTVAETLISEGRFRDAAVLLRISTSAHPPPEPTLMYKARRMLLGCLLQMESWPEAINIAESLQNTASNPQLRAEAILLKAIAFAKSNLLSSAIHAFETLQGESEGSDYAIRASILCASTQLEAGDAHGAIRTATRFIVSYPKHPFTDSAHCLLTAAKLAVKEHKDALALTSTYLSDGSNTENRETMWLYKAKAQLGLRDANGATATLKLCLSECHPSGVNNEALLLLGNTLLSLNDTVEGINALRAVKPEDPKIYDEARLRLAKALADQSKLQDSQEVLTDFLKARPASNRSPEACRALLQTSTTNHTNTESLETLWSLIGHNNSICQIFFAHEVILILQKAYMLAGRTDEFERQLCEKTKTLLGLSSIAPTPCHCSMALLWGAWRNSRTGDPTLSAAHLEKLETATRQMPSIVAPQILSDLATQFDKNGESQKALAVWRSLLKWNPQTRLKDVALLRLGAAAAHNGEPQKAISFFERFEMECGKSALMPEMLLSRARMHFKNNDEPHLTGDLNRIAAAKSAPIKVRAEALLGLGELKIRKEEYENAIIYLQRAYVTCIASHEHAARAYERCAFAFEKINRADAAAQLYSELLNHPDLADTDAAKECRSRQRSTPGQPPSPPNETQ